LSVQLFRKNKKENKKEKKIKAYFVKLYCGRSLQGSSYAVTGSTTEMQAFLSSRVHILCKEQVKLKTHLTCF